METTLRWLILDKTLTPKPPAEISQLLRQVSGMAANINQIARVANARGYVGQEDIRQIQDMQEKLWAAIKGL